MASARYWLPHHRKNELFTGEKNILSKFHLFAALAVALLTLSCGDLRAQQPAREQLDRFAHGLKTFSASFEQRVIGSDGKLQDRSAGKVWLSQPDLIRWEYGGDFPELVVADGKHIWIYDEALEQVTVKPQSDSATDSPLSLLTDIDKLDEQFEVREAGDMDGLFLLDLRPINKEREFDRVLLGMKHDELKLMTLEDSFGLRTEVRFTKPQRNPVLDPKLFTFTPPKGADVIGSPDPDAGTSEP